MQTILRGARSGMWDSQPSPHVDVPVEKPAVSTSAPASENAHTGPTRSLISPIRAIEPPTSLANTEGSALKRIAYAETKMNSGDVNEALSILEEVATEFPNIADNGKTQLLHADCSLRLKNPENALTSIRRFYLKYPKSSDTMSAKILEASAHIELGNHERAIAVYREVIALAPRSSQAQTARSALQKLRDER
jgi:tetratricopeptide (TPR) repeat protein